MFLKKPGEDAIEVELPMLLEWETPMTESGPLTESPAADTVYLLVQTDDYALMDLYAVSMDGEREKVLGDVRVRARYSSICSRSSMIPDSLCTCVLVMFLLGRLPRV